MDVSASRPCWKRFKREWRDNLIIENDVEIDLLLETGGGGSGRHVLDLYAELRRTGWDAHLILSQHRADRGFLEEVAHISRDHVTFINMRRSPHISDLHAISQLKSYIEGSHKRHLLHAHSTKAGMLGAALGKAVNCKVFTPHAYRGMDPSLPWHKAGAIRLAENVFSRAYSKIVAVSPEEEQYLISVLKIPRKRICYIPNGIDSASIRCRVDGASRQREKGTKPVIGFVGRLVHQKDPALFLETFRTVVGRGNAARAVIVGNGPLRVSLERSAAAYNLSHLIDWRGDAPGVEALGEMDVVVHTSRYESFPYTLLEAAAGAIPIVAVENSGSRAILGEELPEAIVASPEPDKLTDAILSVLHDGPTRRRYLAALDVVSQRFTIKNMVKAITSEYVHVLKPGTAYSQAS